MMQLENENGIESNWFERAALVSIYLCLSMCMSVCVFFGSFSFICLPAHSFNCLLARVLVIVKRSLASHSALIFRAIHCILSISFPVVMCERANSQKIIHKYISVANGIT